MPRTQSPLETGPNPSDLKAQIMRWRVAHPQATFAEIEIEATRQLAALRADLIAHVLAACEPEAAPSCPTCSGTMHRVGTQTRTVTTSGPAEVPVTGKRYRCSACGAELPPLAEALQLGASRYSPWLVESAAIVGGTAAFRAAARRLEHFTGVALSPSTIRRLTLAAGSTLRQLEVAFSAEVRTTGTGPERPPDVPLQLSVDGSLIHLRQEGWREVKVLAIGERQADRAGLTNLSYSATLGTVEAFGDEVLGELGRRGIPHAADVVTVNDGAAWIQEIIDLQCPQAQRVLDFAHAAGYLATAATEAYGEGTARQQKWFAAQRATLRDGDPDTVLAAIRALATGEARDQVLGYLTARRPQIAYRDFLAKGWPIGSGCVERAHKQLLQHRMKGQGMRWSRAGATSLIALRVVQANTRWDETWAQVPAQQRTNRQARTRVRREARTIAKQVLPPPRFPMVVDGKPTAEHPWRRFRFPGSSPSLSR